MSDTELDAVKNQLRVEMDKNIEVVHKRITRAAEGIDGARKEIAAVAADMSGFMGEIRAEMRHRPDDGEVHKLINDAVDKRVGEQVLICRGEASGITDTAKERAAHQVQKKGAKDFFAQLIGNAVIKWAAGAAGAGGGGVLIWKIAEAIKSGL